MSEDKQSLLSIINASGFLFQLRVEREIRKLHQHRDTKWAVVSREHRWMDPLSSSERFIDLVLQSDAGRMVIECKRVQDATWVFLIDDGKVDMGRARLLWTYLTDKSGPASNWDEFNFSHSSPESSFCVVRGQGEGDVPMLERLAGFVLRSTESLAEQELQMGTKRPYGPAWIYFPMIVTNAQLYISKFNPDEIDIRSGKLSDTDFRAVPLIRFRKALSTTMAINSEVTSLQETAEEQQRTVFVINAESLKSVLPDAELSSFGTSSSKKLPWDDLR